LIIETGLNADYPKKTGELRLPHNILERGVERKKSHQVICWQWLNHIKTLLGLKCGELSHQGYYTTYRGKYRIPDQFTPSDSKPDGISPGVAFGLNQPSGLVCALRSFSYVRLSSSFALRSPNR